MYDFSVNYKSSDISDIINIHKHVIKKHDVKIIFGFKNICYVIN